jgi:cullin-associated NEDD8-dissociated protein 1
VTEVSHAFKSGRYVLGDREYGKGKYGDLAATFAAIYLDREARNVLLDVDPTTGSLREPILKLMAVMRSMNFSSSFPVTRLSNLKRDIGQEAYEFESVFSFFLPEFKRKCLNCNSYQSISNHVSY